MRDRILPLVMAVWCAAACNAQGVQREQLVMTIGGGGGFTTLTSSIDSLGTGGAETGAVRFAVAYAITDKWSIGVHYDRIGTDRTSSATESLRFTTYMIEGVYRPWIGERGAVELQLAFGPSLMALKPWGQGLPMKAQSTALAFGARYLRMFSGTVGGFIGVDHAASRSANVTDYNGQQISDADNNALKIEWNSQRITAGLMVRF